MNNFNKTYKNLKSVFNDIEIFGPYFLVEYEVIFHNGQNLNSRNKYLLSDISDEHFILSYLEKMEQDINFHNLFRLKRVYSLNKLSIKDIDNFSRLEGFSYFYVQNNVEFNPYEYFYNKNLIMQY